MATEVEAQIAGSVWKIWRSTGESGDGEEVILVIESVEVGIPAEAPCAGRLVEIRVGEGDSVEKGAIPAVID